MLKATWKRAMRLLGIWILMPHTFTVFCITLVGDCTRPRHQETTSTCCNEKQRE